MKKIGLIGLFLLMAGISHADVIADATNVMLGDATQKLGGNVLADTPGEIFTQS